MAGSAALLLAVLVVHPNRHRAIPLLQELLGGPRIIRKKIPWNPEANRNVFRQKIPPADLPPQSPAPDEKESPEPGKKEITQPAAAPAARMENLNEAESGKPLQPQTSVEVPPAPQESAPDSREPAEQTEAESREPLPLQPQSGEEVPTASQEPDVASQTAVGRNQPEAVPQTAGKSATIAPRVELEMPSPAGDKPVLSPPIVTPTQPPKVPYEAELRQAEAPAAGPVVMEADKNTAEKTIHREPWLLAQDASAYTLQLMGVHNERLLFDFIKENRLLEKNEIAYYQTVFKGEPWFQLLYGVYPTLKAARAAAAGLTAELQISPPWIRRLSAVQKTIRRRAAK